MGQCLSLGALADQVDQLKRQGKVVVTTNGCFDLMHVGHLRYLQAARAEGDCLVVLVNSDASVQRLKGACRPIINQLERAEMLAGLACVDFVGIFDEDTPLLWLKRLQPTVHVKGDQYTLDTLPEAPDLQAMGTRIAFAPMVSGKSTSQLIERILNVYQYAEADASCNPLMP